MGDSNESKTRNPSTSTAIENLSLQASRFPRDLLQGFMGSDKRESALEVGKEEEELELNLGLSLGGRFGVDKHNAKKLMRSSSIAGPIPIVRDDDAVAPPPVAYQTLVRTSSLPAETEEEWRKRKELQTLRRMEAKRRRSEKQRILKGDKDSGGSGGGGGGGSLSVAPPFGLPTWAAAARQAVVGGGIDVSMAKGKGSYLQPSSQGSMESQSGSYSNMSELESKPLQGSSGCDEASPTSIQSLQERCSQETAGSLGTKAKEAANKGKEIGMNSIEDMPCVFTDVPNGRRIEGILYKYKKGEEVRIMCVCHGTFLSAAEFVKHAGGTDVANPLKHIVVNPNSSSF